MITIKTPDEIEIMAKGGKILATVIKKLKEMVRPGITTKELDRAAEALILKYGATPSFKGYKGFPFSLCTSVNEEIVHCFPSERALKEGDIISLDLGVLYKGFNTDMAITVGVGKICPEAKRLIKITKKALEIAIKKIRPGISVGEIGNVIQKYTEKNDFSVVRAAMV